MAKQSLTIYGLSDELVQKLRAAADGQRRSVSEFVVMLLEDEFDPPDQPGRVKAGPGPKRVASERRAKRQR